MDASAASKQGETVKNVSKLVVVFAGAMALCGCAGNPLVGTWTANQTEGGLNGTVAMTLVADGTASLNINFTGGMSSGTTITCNGAGITQSGFRWTSTATTLSVTGTPTCTGSIMCTAGGNVQTLDCSRLSMGGMGPSTLDASTYALSNNNNTLTITTTPSGTGMATTLTFTRRM
jgi:hypothetical protein